MRIHDTIIVCRPEQVREAAVVLACCPAERFTPLLVIERPPISEAEYRKLYAAYVEARNRRDALTGTVLAREQAVRRTEEVVQLNAEVDRNAQTLTSYRSWWRHQRLVTELLATLPLRQAIFLFDPPHDEIQLINPLPISRLSEDRQPSIPPAIHWLYLLPESGQRSASGDPHPQFYRSLEELTDLAWHVCGHQTPLPAETVEAPLNDLRSCFAGLHAALRRGWPLRLKAVAAEPPSVPGDAATEAVLVEVTNDATRLLGVQYAHHRAASLALTPEPEYAPIENARAAIEAQHGTKAAEASGNKSLLSNLRAYLFGDPAAAELLGRLEQAVSSVVPDEVVAAIGERPLTVFTGGIPYNFVRKSGTDWSQKPIGHITGDASLLILTEICRTQPDPSAGFSLIFDPGYFDQTGETRNVLAQLNQRPSFPLVLRQAASSSLALQHLGTSLPLDIVFFNTHGSDHGILLDDGELPAFKLQQRVTLPSRPFVFNSSCLSWVGVGREFISVGARGYIGTLWSVDAAMAANYAREVFSRMTRHALPVSWAMRGTSADPVTERAYVFIGSCAACLGQPQLGDATTQQVRLGKIAGSLLESLIAFYQFNVGHTTVALVSSLEDLLFDQAEKLLAEYDARWPQPHPDRLQLAVLYLRLLSYALQRRPQVVQSRLSAVSKTEALLNALNLEPKAKLTRQAEVLHMSGRIQARLGHLPSAIDILTRSVQAAEQAGESIAPPALELSDALKAAGRLLDALAAAKRAEASYAADAESAKRKLLALGRLAQLSSALGDFPNALRYARQGFGLATTLDIPAERAAFKGDEARMLLCSRRLPEALAAAKEFLDLARLAYDDRQEIDAYGVMAQALLNTGNLTDAMEYATKGLARSEQAGFHDAVADFLMDIASIQSRQGAHERALDYALKAALIHVQLDRSTKARNSMGFATDQYNRLVARNPTTNTWPVLSKLLQVELNLIESVDPCFRRAVVIEVVGQIGKLIKRVGLAPLRQPLEALTSDAAARLRAQPSACDELRFVAQAIEMYTNLAAGHPGEARASAQDLDCRWGGGPVLSGFVDEVTGAR